ncbi:hypothetical protein [Demequina sp.]|uniref:hypothetical protein n=1 Tax=Demequina sp. TaxID=2050685 RepID=UPI003D0E0A33
MHRFSARNVIAWIAGAAAVVAFYGMQIGFFNRWITAVLVTAGVVAFGYWLWEFFEKYRHAKRVREFAFTHGWQYSEEGWAANAGLTGFPFGVGSNRKATDLIEGTYSGMPCSTYTYSFEYRVGDDRAAEQVFTVTQTAIDYRLPTLDLVPEDIGSRIIGALGGADIDLESAEFNRLWRVLCPDRRFAIDVVDPRMMQHLLHHRIPGVAVRIDRDKVIAWSAGRADLGQLAKRFDLVTGIAKRVPNHVVRSYTEAEQRRRAEEAEREAKAPGWANTPGVLNSGRYTGIGVDADGDGVDDWEQRTR